MTNPAEKAFQNLEARIKNDMDLQDALEFSEMTRVLASQGVAFRELIILMVELGNIEFGGDMVKDFKEWIVEKSA